MKFFRDPSCGRLTTVSIPLRWSGWTPLLGVNTQVTTSYSVWAESVVSSLQPLVVRYNGWRFLSTPTSKPPHGYRSFIRVEGTLIWYLWLLYVHSGAGYNDSKVSRPVENEKWKVQYMTGNKQPRSHMEGLSPCTM